MIKTPLPSPIPIPVQPTLVFGASHIPDSIAEGNPDRKEIIYLAGKIIVIREMLSQKVNLIRLSDNVSQVHFIGVSPDHRNIIVSETLSNDTSLSLGIYSIADKSKRLFRILASNPGNYFRLFSFSESSPSLVLALSQSNQIYVVDLDKLRHICYFNLENQQVTSIKVCIHDSHLISLCSRDSIRVYRLQEYTLKPLEAVKGVGNRHFTVQMWNEGGLFVGTQQGSILWISYHNGCYQLQSQLKLTASVLYISRVGSNKLVSVSHDGFVLLWESDYRNSKYGIDYEIIRTWRLPVGRANTLSSFVVTQSLEEIVMGFEDNHIGVVDALEMYSRGPSVQQLQLEYLYKGSNQGGISSTDICLQRPVVVSVSKIDRSVRVYNYRLNRCDLVKYYTEKNDSQIECVSIHPSGYYLALGFADRLRVLNLLHNDLRTYKQILFRHVEHLKFSQSGAYLSVSSAKSSEEISSWQLILLNSYTLETIHSFIDWNSPIISVRFCRSDSLLVGMCNGGSLKLCTIGAETSSTKIAPRSNKIYTSMAVYEPVDNIKHKLTLSVFSCSPHPKEGSTIRECKEVARKYVQKFFEIREYNITTLEVFERMASQSYRLLAGSVEGVIILYNLPFDGIPLFVVNAHPAPISSFSLSPCGSLLFSGCKQGILVCSEIQSWEDVSKTPQGLCLDQTLSDIMMISIKGLKDTEDKNRKLITDINQVEQRSKQMEKDMRGKYQEKLINLIKEKDGEIQEMKEKFRFYLSETKRIEAQHKEELDEVENRNSQAASDLEALFQRKIYLENEQNVKLRHQMTAQEERYKAEIEQLQNIHSQNINTLTEEFNGMLNKTATLYRKETTKQKVSEKGYQQKLRIIDEEYQSQIQRLIEKHNAEESKKTQNILKLNREIDALKSSIKGYRDEITESNAEIRYLKDEIQEMKLISESKEKNIQELDSLLEEKQGFVTETNNRMNEMKSRFKDSEKKKMILNIKAAEWREAIQPREKEIERLRDKLFELQGELDTLINKEEIHINTIETLEIEKVRLSKLTKQQSQAMKGQEIMFSNILMDIKTVLDKPKDTNRSYYQEVMLLFRKYNPSGERHLGGNTIQSLGEINRQVMHLERTLDIKSKSTQKTIDQRNFQLNKRSVENNELIRDLNQYKVKFKQQELELRGKQKVIDDLSNDLKQYSIRKSSRVRDVDHHTDRTTNHQTPLSITRSNSLRVHKLSKGSNYQPTLISNQKKQKLVEITSENELMRQYITKLENREAIFKERVVKHLKGCSNPDKVLEELVS